MAIAGREKAESYASSKTWDIIRIVQSNPTDMETQISQVLRDIENAAVIDTVFTMLNNLYQHNNGQLMKDLIELLLLDKADIAGTPTRASVLRGYWAVLNETFQGDASALLKACEELQGTEDP